jgi:hypothetical protein
LELEVDKADVVRSLAAGQKCTSYSNIVPT